MIKLLDILKEARQVGTLYHFTDPRGLESILETNMMKIVPNYINAEERDIISFTRNKNFKWGTIRISIDGDKLSQNYRITPHSYAGYHLNPTTDQSEEIVTKDIKNIKNYIIEISYVLDMHGEFGSDVPIDYLFELWPSMKLIYKGKEYSKDQLPKEFKFPSKISKRRKPGLYDIITSYDDMKNIEGKIMFIFTHIQYSSRIDILKSEISNEIDNIFRKYVEINNKKSPLNYFRIILNMGNNQNLLDDLIDFCNKYKINYKKEFYGDFIDDELRIYKKRKSKI